MSDPPVIPTLLRNWRVIGLTTLGVGVGSALATLAMPNWYTATVQLVPESSSGGLSGLAGQLGALSAFAGFNLNLADRAGARSPRFYLSLLGTRPLLDSVLLRHYAAGDPPPATRPDSGTLVGVLTRGKPDDRAQRVWRARRLLQGLTRSSSDPRTGIIAIEVRMRSPTLAAAVAAAYAEELVRFNQAVRLSQARATREFVATRVEEVAQALRTSEEALRVFVTRNREYEGSPALVFEHARLQRNLTMQQELYVNLRQKLDVARIAEQDDIPTLTLIEPAAVPARKSSPKRTVLTLTATIFAAIGISFAVWFRATGSLQSLLTIRAHEP